MGKFFYELAQLLLFDILNNNNGGLLGRHHSIQCPSICSYGILVCYQVKILHAFQAKNDFNFKLLVIALDLSLNPTSSYSPSVSTYIYKYIFHTFTFFFSLTWPPKHKTGNVCTHCSKFMYLRQHNEICLLF